MRISARSFRGGVIPVLLFAFLTVSLSVAGDKKKQTGGEEIRVLANLPLQEVHVNQLFVREEGNKSYLYLHQPNDDYAVVDVTKPEKPTLQNRSAAKPTTPEGTVGGSPLAITTTQDEGTAVQKTPPKELPGRTVNFVDTSNPKESKTIKSFNGVTAMYSDDARKLVYLVNAEGLWVVRHRNTTPVPICGASGISTSNCPPF
jgi:hypothetical protein